MDINICTGFGWLGQIATQAAFPLETVLTLTIQQNPQLSPYGEELTGQN